MKKTLFAMLALALCGTAFAWEGSTSTLKDTELRNFNEHMFGYFTQDVTLKVDSSETFVHFMPDYALSLTLNFEGEHYLKASEDLLVYSYDYEVAINGNEAALAYWGNSLTSTDGLNYVPLAIAVDDSCNVMHPDVATFMGNGESTPITLGDSDMTYLGYILWPDQEKLETSIGANQFALVGIYDRDIDGVIEGFYLVGRGASTPVVPEPATATLSLLALAGLATRRKRK